MEVQGPPLSIQAARQTTMPNGIMAATQAAHLTMLALMVHLCLMVLHALQITQMMLQQCRQASSQLTQPLPVVILTSTAWHVAVEGQ